MPTPDSPVKLPASLSDIHGLRTIRPYGDQILIKPQVEFRRGGIFIPDSVKEPPVRGIVVATGPGKHFQSTGVFQPMDERIQPGVTVLYGKYDGTAHAGFMLVREEAVLAILESPAAPVEAEAAQPGEKT